MCLQCLIHMIYNHAVLLKAQNLIDMPICLYVKLYSSFSEGIIYVHTQSRHKLFKFPDKKAHSSQDFVVTFEMYNL